VTRTTALEHGRVGAVPITWFTREGVDRDRVVIYLHGGGYSVGSVRSHTDLIARIAEASGARVVAPEYRLAPEHPFPTQLEDAISVYLHLLARGVAPSRVVLAGESAGAGLSLSTMIALRDRGLPLPAGAALVSPWVDLEATSASVVENAAWDFVTRRGLDVYARRFVRPADLRNPLAAPIHADLRGLPPLLVQVGEVEALRDDGVRLAERARAAGVEVELEIWPDMIHAFHVFAPMLADARAAIERIGAFCRARTGAEPLGAVPSAS
jgi:acetyl esterase/lipase